MDEAASTPSAASPSSAPKSAGNCPNCADPFATDDVFCENCGYDFATGTLPTEDPDPASSPAPVAAASPPITPAPDAPEAPATPTPDGSASATPEAEEPPASTPSETVAVVSVDRTYFDEIVGGADLDFPNPAPDPVRIPLTGSKVLIGRHNEGRGVYPELDVKKLTGDPAVSTRHAMLQRSETGAWTITDLRSTNGTLLDEETTAIEADTAVVITMGTMIYVGAFTRITLEAAAG